MLRRLQLLSVLAAWLLASGSQWDVMQVLAWGRMVAVYSQNMSVVEAVQLTFRREGMCDVCRLVESAKHQEQEQAGAVPGADQREGKVLFFQPAAGETIRVAGADERWALTHDALPPSERAAPPAPPPRSAVS